jgi:hypothetical protein
MITESEREQLSRQIGLSMQCTFLDRTEVHFLAMQADKLATFGIRAFISTKDRQELDRIFEKSLQKR